MKKIILITLFFAIAFSISFAQKPQSIPIVINGNDVKAKKQVYTKQIDGKAIPVFNDNFKRVPKNILKSKSNFISKSTVSVLPNKALDFNKIESNSNLEEELNGAYSCKGISYFGGSVTGETVIRTDEINANKIWISNLVPGGSNKEVYGIVASDKKTISIPQGQKIFVDGADIAYLSIYGSTDPLIVQINASVGVLTVNAELWGAEANDGWYELFMGKVTYTRMDMLPPVASYRQPDGGLFLGFVPETWDSYISSAIISSGYSTWEWKNTSLEEEVSYSWTYTDSITGQNFYSDIDSLVMDVRENYYMTPTLKATNKQGFSSSYVLGADFGNKDNPSYSIAGGNASWLGFDENCDYGAANNDNGFTLLRAGENSYFFGTGVAEFADDNIESLLVFYEEPITPLYFEGVNAYLFVLDAPDDTPFTMNIVLAEKNDEDKSFKGKVLATSTIKAKDAIPIIYNDQVLGYTLKFTDFEEVDEDGFSVVKEYIETDKAFFLELTGFNIPGVTLAVCSEELNPTDGDSRSNFIVEGDTSIYSWVDYRQTMYINLAGALYPYISLSRGTVWDNRFGGTYEIEVTPYFDTLSIENESFPDWLSVEVLNEEYSENKWGATLSITIKPLDASSDPRYFDIELKTTAATRILHINQGGEYVSIKDIQENLVSVSKIQAGFMVKYPAYMKRLTVFNALGLEFGTYNLPETGNFELSGSKLPEGLYILKVEGADKTETIKIMK